jgi:hypothetical protein
MTHLFTWPRLIVLSLADLLSCYDKKSSGAVASDPEADPTRMCECKPVRNFQCQSPCSNLEFNADEDVDDECEQVELRKMNKSGKA